ncbi:MAG: cytochrome c [Rhodocyclaceae bacterium]|nr:cytochrome c [Rhodocyclaceae bacterium]MDZ4215406.1 cytochrome c [Rhodocyclaceae bacterium]
MRATWVRIIVVASGALAILLALFFAWTQNPGTTPTHVAARAEPSLMVKSGRAVYQAQGCASCHAIAGDGNPRYPLDGVGDRRDAVALRDWTIATDAAATLLPRRAAVMKEDYRDLGSDEIEALVAYLSSLGAPARPASD